MKKNVFERLRKVEEKGEEKKKILGGTLHYNDVPLYLFENNTERDLNITHINNTEEQRGALNSHTPSQHSSLTRTDPQNQKVSRPDMSTTCPTSSHSSTSVTYLRTAHHRTRGTHLRSQNGECVCMAGFRSSKRNTQRRERKRLPSGPPTSTSRTTLIGSWIIRVGDH